MMKKITIVFIMLLITCALFSQDQTDLNRQALSELKEIEQEMEDIYQEILNQYNAENIFLDKFITSQEVWIQYRDAYLEAFFPEEDKMNYGSTFLMCYRLKRIELTEERIEHLRIWLDGVPQGDVCRGSVK